MKRFERVLRAIGWTTAGIIIGVLATDIYFENFHQTYKTTTSSSVKGAWRPDYTADDIFNRVNEYRVSQGLKPLAKDPLLCETAQEKADDMVKNNYFDHYIGKTFDDLILQKYPTPETISENLSMSRERVDDIVSGWIESPTHQKNMSSDTDAGCVAIANDQKTRTTKIVQHFIKY